MTDNRHRDPVIFGVETEPRIKDGKRSKLLTRDPIRPDPTRPLKLLKIEYLVSSSKLRLTAA